jgi:hypothetical protein
MSFAVDDCQLGSAVLAGDHGTGVMNAWTCRFSRSGAPSSP